MSLGLRRRKRRGWGDLDPRGYLSTRLALRASEAAGALGISERALRGLRSRLPHLYLDKVLLFPVEGLREPVRRRALFHLEDQYQDELSASLMDDFWPTC